MHKIKDQKFKEFIGICFFFNILAYKFISWHSVVPKKLLKNVNGIYILLDFFSVYQKLWIPRKIN